MMKRIAILIGSVAAVGVLTVGLVAAGFGPVATSAPEIAEAASTATEGAKATPEAKKAKVVYVKPAPKQRTIVVERPTQNVASAPSTSGSRVRTVRVRAVREDGREREDHEDRQGREGREEHDD